MQGEHWEKSIDKVRNNHTMSASCDDWLAPGAGDLESGTNIGSDGNYAGDVITK